jgi:hypothetical protein
VFLLSLFRLFEGYYKEVHFIPDFLQQPVLPLKMVDNSTSPFQTHFGPVFG